MKFELKELEEAIRLSEIYLEANGPRLAPIYNGAIRVMIKAAELTAKYKELMEKAENCGHCCPCPHQKFCPVESLYQELREALEINDTLRENKLKEANKEIKGCNWCDNTCYE